ncbi:N-ethylmaleimide reductase [Mesorhizobium prunaredense]|uniref:N-ethylmaleimide reductase n=1 Tax=Mesorhizobium prunaredense TaxID=1631249 RepID=A0A1R3V4S1_9HYPH|nr:alkene reductase [Mesorhizobium prunaredense]SIT54871.1 N-ethylmaleimide reductase [Mesorhizobium prunaredense]
MSNLFSPIHVGAFDLSHRVVLAPLTRMRAEIPGNVPGQAMADYYASRATPGGLLIAEATYIARQGNGGFGSPGIETDDQAAGWRKVVDAVHARGATIVLQLWHVGRVSHVSLQPDGGVPVAPSEGDAGLGVLLKGRPGPATAPRALAMEEIAAVVEQYRAAAERAKQAGFDGIEMHGANGYLIDQFLQDGSNRRTDIHGGSIESRARFLFEVVDAVTTVWSPDRVGVRVGPSNTFNQMHDSDPQALFAHVAKGLGDRSIAYLHVIEPRVKGNAEVGEMPPVAAENLKPIFQGPVIAAGGFNAADAAAIVARGGADLVAFGRHFIANPDLVHRLKEKLPLNKYDRETFYYGGAKGYSDYPLYDKTIREEVA